MSFVNLGLVSGWLGRNALAQAKGEPLAAPADAAVGAAGAASVASPPPAVAGAAATSSGPKADLPFIDVSPLAPGQTVTISMKPKSGGGFMLPDGAFKDAAVRLTWCPTRDDTCTAIIANDDPKAPPKISVSSDGRSLNFTMPSLKEGATAATDVAVEVIRFDDRTLAALASSSNPECSSEFYYLCLPSGADAIVKYGPAETATKAVVVAAATEPAAAAAAAKPEPSPATPPAAGAGEPERRVDFSPGDTAPFPQTAGAEPSLPEPEPLLPAGPEAAEEPPSTAPDEPLPPAPPEAPAEAVAGPKADASAAVAAPTEPASPAKTKVAAAAEATAPAAEPAERPWWSRLSLVIEGSGYPAGRDDLSVPKAPEEGERGVVQYEVVPCYAISEGARVCLGLGGQTFEEENRQNPIARMDGTLFVVDPRFDGDAHLIGPLYLAYQAGLPVAFGGVTTTVPGDPLMPVSAATTRRTTIAHIAPFAGVGPRVKGNLGPLDFEATAGLRFYYSILAGANRTPTYPDSRSPVSVGPFAGLSVSLTPPEPVVAPAPVEVIPDFSMTTDGAGEIEVGPGGHIYARHGAIEKGAGAVQTIAISVFRDGRNVGVGIITKTTTSSTGWAFTNKDLQRTPVAVTGALDITLPPLMTGDTNNFVDTEGVPLADDARLKVDLMDVNDKLIEHGHVTFRAPIVLHGTPQPMAPGPGSILSISPEAESGRGFDPSRVTAVHLRKKDERDPFATAVPTSRKTDSGVVWKWKFPGVSIGKLQKEGRIEGRIKEGRISEGTLHLDIPSGKSHVTRMDGTSETVNSWKDIPDGTTLVVTVKTPDASYDFEIEFKRPTLALEVNETPIQVAGDGGQIEIKGTGFVGDAKDYTAVVVFPARGAYDRMEIRLRDLTLKGDGSGMTALVPPILGDWPKGTYDVEITDSSRPADYNKATAKVEYTSDRTPKAALMVIIKDGRITGFSEVSFNLASAQVTRGSQKNLDKSAEWIVGALRDGTLAADDQVIIPGHTDSSGSDQVNYKWSLLRAEAVAQNLRSACERVVRGLKDADDATKKQLRGQIKTLFVAEGHGESDLIYDADDKEDANSSRRIEYLVRKKDDPKPEMAIRKLSEIPAAVKALQEMRGTPKPAAPTVTSGSGSAVTPATATPKANTAEPTAAPAVPVAPTTGAAGSAPAEPAPAGGSPDAGSPPATKSGLGVE